MLTWLTTALFLVLFVACAAAVGASVLILLTQITTRTLDAITRLEPEVFRLARGHHSLTR